MTIYIPNAVLFMVQRLIENADMGGIITKKGTYQIDLKWGENNG